MLPASHNLLNEAAFPENSENRNHSGELHHHEVQRLRQSLARKSRQCVDMAEELKLLHSELQDAQLRVSRYERLACLGELTAGIAHEVNNLLAYMMFNLGSIESEIDSGFEKLRLVNLGQGGMSAVEESLSMCRQITGDSLDGMDRIQEIVKGLKDFANDRTTEVVWVNVNSIVEASLRLIAGEIRSRVTVEKTLADLPKVLAYPRQLSQVLLNLFVNAAQAMKSEGKLAVRTERGNDEVWIHVEDNGSGIPEEIKGRIFDPFFTTKANGVGTGLGLGVAAEIMNRHWGKLEFESKEGEGTTFSVGLRIQNPDLEKVFQCQKKEPGDV